MPRRPALLAVLLAFALAGVGAPAAGALTTHPCPTQRGFLCATVRVPLDRTGAIPGTVKLAVAVQRPRRGARGFLVALAGGPGQAAVPLATSFRASLRPALRHRRLVVVDQRGTGASGALRCPSLQRLGNIDPIRVAAVAGCAERLGARRAAYATADSVADLDAVRAALRAPSLELMGVSYGTYVAAQYARTYPSRVDGLILDSVVAAGGVDPFSLDTLGALPRVLAAQCGHGRCRTATADPVADLRRLTRELASGPVRARVPDVRGRVRRGAIAGQSALLLMVMAGDLNPFLQAALPGAVAAAARGDAAPLVRLRRYANGPPTPTRELSVGLNVATTCADLSLPYSFAEPFDERWTRWQHALDGVPSARYAPFSTATVLDSSVAHDCLHWPTDGRTVPPSTAALPDVPALLLSGRLDLRTPLENQAGLRAELPQAASVVVSGTGHDVLDSDITGCAARALARFASRQRVGTPCRGRSNAVAVQPRPPRSLTDFRSAPGVRGRRGRALFATLDTVGDAELSVLQALVAGFREPAGGGLRAGRFRATPDLTRVRLTHYALVPEVRLDGTLRTTRADGLIGTVRVAAGPSSGTLRLDRGGRVAGVLGGRPVRYDPRRAHVSSDRVGRAPYAVTARERAAALRIARAG